MSSVWARRARDKGLAYWGVFVNRCEAGVPKAGVYGAGEGDRGEPQGVGREMTKW